MQQIGSKLVLNMREHEQEINIGNVDEFSSKFFVSDVQQSVWHALSEYENEAYSVKLIEANYKINKFGSRNYKKAATFFSFNMRQGVEYFRNSIKSSLAIKPLLLYYGIMSFAKAIIVYNNPEYLKKMEKEDNRRHGLTYVPKNSNKFCINSDKVRIKAPGTFNFFQGSLDFSEIQGNTEISLSKLYSWMTGFSFVATDIFIPGKDYKELLEQIPVATKTKLFKQIKKNKKGLYEGEASINISIPTVYLSVTNHKKDIKKIIPELLGFRVIHYDGENIVLNGLKEKFDPYSEISEFIAIQKVLWKLNKISHYDSRSIFLFQRLDGSDFIGQPYVYYLISFILGSICRYDPIKWVEMIEAKKTNEKWLVELAINEITNNFPLFVLGHFSKNHIKFILK